MSKAKFGQYVVVFFLALTLGLGAIPVQIGTATVEAEEGKEFTLTILHTNDVHAHYQPFDAYAGSCEIGEECTGGSARVADAVSQIRGEGGNVLLLDAGDQFQGTLFFNQYKGQAARALMNAIGYEAMAIGNHEFDSGPEILTEFVAKADFPVLSANLDIDPAMALADLVKPWVVLEVGGEKVGVFGLVTEDLATISSPGPGVKTTDAVEAAKSAVAELEQQGVDKIIALTHIGYLADQDLASKVDGIDVIVGGHSHTLLSNVDESAAGPYPTVVQSPGGQPVLVVTDGAYARALGDLTVTFDADGVPSTYTGEPIILGDSVGDIVARLNAPIQELKETLAGETAVDLIGDRTVCRFEECNMGDLITDAMLVNTAQDGTQIAITNGGGIRASIKAGNVSVGQVLEVLPFGNTVATFGLKGEDLLVALENGVSQAENPENEGTGRFPQVSGMRFTWDPSKPVGSRIGTVEVGNETDGYEPLDPEATYQIASNNFVRTGGDGYEVFAEKAIDPYDYGSLLADAVMEYIAAESPVSQDVEGRITKK
jgi:5'-nucleotidase/UDP-sugar diphosphatase